MIKITITAWLVGVALIQVFDASWLYIPLGSLALVLAVHIWLLPTALTVRFFPDEILGPQPSLWFDARIPYHAIDWGLTHSSAAGILIAASDYPAIMIPLRFYKESDRAEIEHHWREVQRRYRKENDQYKARDRAEIEHHWREVLQRYRD